MSEPALRRATYEDILTAPDGLIAELIRGSLVTSPRPAGRYSFAASTLSMDLGSPFQRGRGGPGTWWILDEPELHLGHDVLVPDLAGWRRERMPEVPAGPYIELAPDWLCEVLSPSTEAHDRTEKLEIYGEAGVAWVWLINPRVETLEVLERRESSWVRQASFRGQAVVRAQPYEAIELALADLWLPQQQG